MLTLHAIPSHHGPLALIMPFALIFCSLTACSGDPDDTSDTGATDAANTGDGAQLGDAGAATGNDAQSADSIDPRHDASGSGSGPDTASTPDSDQTKVTPCTGKKAGAPCSDGNPCTVGDHCKDDICKAGKTKLTCDDGDPCTKDGCHGELACWHEPDPDACDDGNPCTTDTCTKADGCESTPLKPGDSCATDACFIGQACSKSLLCLGGKKKLCDDDNACTDDSCHKKQGCIFKINAKICADGFACTVKDSCNGGVCVGQKTNTCPICNNQFGPWAGQLNEILLGVDGKKGNGIDVDADKKTCAPDGSCKGGIDNSMGVLAFAVNKPLANAMKAGTMRFVVELADYKGEGKPFSLRLYYGNLSPGAKGCNWLTTSCSWLITQQSMGPDCMPLADFPNARISKGKLTAGGPDQVFALEANLAGSVKPTFYIKGARIEADIKLDPAAPPGKPKIVSLNGVIGGAMTEVAVMTVFNALPEKNFKPLDKKSALALVKSLLVLDIDVDGDGTKDAASLGIRIVGIGATIAGMSL